MLYLVGLGLGDIKDITVKGLEIVKQCDKVGQAQAFPTSIGNFDSPLPHYHVNNSSPNTLSMVTTSLAELDW